MVESAHQLENKQLVTIMPLFTDQLGYSLYFDKPPQRIVSLVPSQTEYLVDLGLAECVVGITKFCIHPKEFFKQTTKVGGTKQFNFGKIDALQPDLIIGNKEENYEQGINQLKTKYPVWLSDIYTLPDAYQMLWQLAEITAQTSKATKIITAIQQSFAELAAKPLPLPTALYLIWREPYMAAAQPTFIDQMLLMAGFQNVLSPTTQATQEITGRYPTLSLEQLKQLNPAYLLLSSEPYPFKPKHELELQKLLPQSKILLVDGEMFSWYGSRLALAAEYFKKLSI